MKRLLPLLLVACQPATPAVRVPRASSPVVVDGEFDEHAWRTPARSMGFLQEGTRDPARPYSDVRVTWDADALLVVFYAADADIRSDDAFDLELAAGEHRFLLGVTAAGRVLDHGGSAALAAASRAAVDLDGTLDHPGDPDEEWAVEAAFPFSAMGVVPRAGTRVGFRVRRCEHQATPTVSCGTWGDDGVVLELSDAP